MKPLYILQQLRSVYGFAYVQEIENEFRSYFPELPACLLTKIFIARDKRGCHYGSTLLDRILADADREQITVYLQVAPDDDSPLDAMQTRKFYERHGFERVKTTPLMIRRPSAQGCGGSHRQRDVDSVGSVRA